MRSAVFGACLLLASTARADEPSDAAQGPGLALTLGGGLFGFIDDEARDATDTVGPQFELGLLLGSRRHVGLELSYVGRAQDMEPPGGEGATVFAHSAEGAAQVRLLLGTVRPFLFAGAAVKVYVQSDSSSLPRNDTVAEIPVGGGVAIHVNAFVFDIRGAYRFAFDEELGTSGFDPELDSWSSTVRVGFEL